MWTLIFFIVIIYVCLQKFRFFHKTLQNLPKTISWKLFIGRGSKNLILKIILEVSTF